MQHWAAKRIEQVHESQEQDNRRTRGNETRGNEDGRFHDLILPYGQVYWPATPATSPFLRRIPTDRCEITLDRIFTQFLYQVRQNYLGPARAGWLSRLNGTTMSIDIKHLAPMPRGSDLASYL
jgi:hypothetical protein